MTYTHAHMTTNPTSRSLSDTRAPMFVNMCMSSSVHTRLHNTCTQKHAHESLHIIMAAHMRTHTHALALRRAWTHTQTHTHTCRH